MPQTSDREWIRAKLERERPWSAYALADLEPEYFGHTAWFHDPEGRGLTLVYSGYSHPLIFCIETSEKSGSVLDEIDCMLNNSNRYIVVGTEGIELVRKRYRIQEEWPTIRMALEARHFRPAPAEDVTPLAPSHLGAVHNLYRQHPPQFFLDQMLANGIYFGIYEGTDLVSIAGTHIISSLYGVAGLGNVYTRPDRRAKGYAARVTSAVSRTLLSMGITTIVLNVRQENAPAIRVYERLGFTRHCVYLEMIGF